MTVSEDVAFAAAVERAYRAGAVACHRIHPGGDRAVLRALGGASAWLVVDRRRIVRRELWADLARARTEGAEVLVLADLGALDPVTGDGAGWAEIRHDLAWTSPRLIQAIGLARRGEGWSGLDGESLRRRAAELNAAAGKARLLEEVAEALGQAQVPGTRRGRALSVLEELLMNALYDAFEATVEQRKDPGYALAAGRHVRVNWSVTPEAVQFRVSDVAGSLRARTLYETLRAHEQQPQATVTRTPGRGGGVGLFLVLRNCKRFEVYVRAGQVTEVSALVSLAASDETARETLTYFGPGNFSK